VPSWALTASTGVRTVVFMTTTNFHNRVMLALLVSMVLGLALLAAKAGAADGAPAFELVKSFVPYGL